MRSLVYALGGLLVCVFASGCWLSRCPDPERVSQGRVDVPTGMTVLRCSACDDTGPEGDAAILDGMDLDGMVSTDEVVVEYVGADGRRYRAVYAVVNIEDEEVDANYDGS